MLHDPGADTAIELSISEIAALTGRALRGAGRNWGEAEEGEQAACWLARAGLDWDSALLEVLEQPDIGADCPLRAGMMLADHATLPDGVPQAGSRRYRLNCPGFLLPFAAQIADRTGHAILLEWGGARAVLAPGCAPDLRGRAEMTGRAEVTIGPTGRAGVAGAGQQDWPQTHRGSVSAAQYARLSRFMMAFTVPSSAGSRAGAGAQGDDYD